MSEDIYAKAVQQAERRPLVARFCPSVVVQFLLFAREWTHPRAFSRADPSH